MVTQIWYPAVDTAQEVEMIIGPSRIAFVQSRVGGARCAACTRSGCLPTHLALAWDRRDRLAVGLAGVVPGLSGLCCGGRQPPWEYSHGTLYGPGLCALLGARQGPDSPAGSASAGPVLCFPHRSPTDWRGRLFPRGIYRPGAGWRKDRFNPI